MKCIYFNDNGCHEGIDEPATAIISAIVVDASARRNLRELIKEIVGAFYGPENSNKLLRWADIDAENLTPYAHVLRMFRDTDSLSFETITIRDFTFNKRYPAYLQIVQDVYDRYDGEEVRVFLPPRKNKKKLMELRNALAKIGIVCEVNENPLQESRFYQMANIGGGMIRYVMNETYEAHMGEKGRPQLIEFALKMKKADENKMVFLNYDPTVPYFVEPPPPINYDDFDDNEEGATS